MQAVLEPLRPKFDLMLHDWRRTFLEIYTGLLKILFRLGPLLCLGIPIRRRQTEWLNHKFPPTDYKREIIAQPLQSTTSASFFVEDWELVDFRHSLWLVFLLCRRPGS